MPKVVVQNVLEYLSTTPSKEPQLIFTLLYYTGARHAEITGLLKSDVHPDGPIPYLSVYEHAHRRLKNDWSNRAIPLSPAALECAKKALTLVPDRHLFSPATPAQTSAVATVPRLGSTKSFVNFVLTKKWWSTHCGIISGTESGPKEFILKLAKHSKATAILSEKRQTTEVVSVLRTSMLQFAR